MKNIKSEANHIKQWRRLDMPPSAWSIDITQLTHVCGRVLDLRIVVTEQGRQVLEAYCATDLEVARAESLVHQAAADEVLRRDINSRCSNEIGTLVDSVLKRAMGR